MSTIGGTTGERLPDAGRLRAKKLLLASACASLLAFSTFVPGATAAVKPDRSIEAFYGRDLVLITGYPASVGVKIDVLRNGVNVGSVTGKTGAAGTADAGTLEINHIGEGDCWNAPVTPDIKPGDTVRTTVLNGAGNPNADRDFTVVRDVGVDFDAMQVNAAAGTITVSGHARSLTNAPIAPGQDTLELRLNKGNPANTWDVFPGGDQDREGRKDLRVDIGGDLDASGNFTRTLNVGTDDAEDVQTNGVDQIIEWSPAAAGAEEGVIPELTVFDEDEGVPPGCPLRADNAVTSGAPKTVNIANLSNGLKVAGISLDASAVSVKLNDRNSATPAATAAATLSADSGSQTWRANFTPEQVDGLRDGRLTVRGVYTVGGVNLRGPALVVQKDTVAPAKPTATPAPGVYPRTQFVTLDAQPGTSIHYTRDGSRPIAKSPVFNRQIRIASTTTLKAIAIDEAGNKSTVSSFRYRIT